MPFRGLPSSHPGVSSGYHVSLASFKPGHFCRLFFFLVPFYSIDFFEEIARSALFCFSGTALLCLPGIPLSFGRVLCPQTASCSGDLSFSGHHVLTQQMSICLSLVADVHFLTGQDLSGFSTVLFLLIFSSLATHQRPVERRV